MLKKIRSFCEVVQQHSLAAAARQLGISTPMMTRHIQQLEQELGVKLLNRSTRGMNLTESGALFYEQALNMLSSYEAGKRAVTQHRQGISGRIKLALPASIAFEYVVPRLHLFYARYPDLELSIVQGNHLLDMIHQGFDCVMHCGQMPSSNFYYTKIRSWRKCVCVSPAYLETCNEMTHPSMLQQYKSVLHTQNKAQTWKFNDIHSSNEMALYMEGHYKVDSSVLLAKMTAQGLGFSYLPAFTVEPYLKTGELRAVLEEWMPAPLDMFMVYPHKDYINNKLKVIIDFISECVSCAKDE